MPASGEEASETTADDLEAPDAAADVQAPRTLRPAAPQDEDIDSSTFSMPSAEWWRLSLATCYRIGPWRGNMMPHVEIRLWCNQIIMSRDSLNHLAIIA
jgi:hypothetical protein